MPDPSLRFDDYTEEHKARQLQQLRLMATQISWPDEIHLEVGANRARFLCDAARARPDETFVGIEIRKKIWKLGKKLLSREGITNADYICADANLAIPILVDDAQISDFYLLYPDPWWKARHHKRRVIQEDFLDVLSRKIKPGGRLWIRTDVGTLADAMMDELSSHDAFRAVGLRDYPMQSFVRSTREQTSIDLGLPIHALFYERI